MYLQLGFLGRADSIPSVSASAIPLTALIAEKIKPSTPRALEVSEIRQIIDMHTKAALNAIEAGFDGVEIHGANGYLLDQFMHSGSNKRTDEYGGSAENRVRIVLETIEAISTAIGQERTALRVSPFSEFQEMHDDNRVETWSVLTQAIQDRFPNLSYLHFVESRVDGNSEDSLEPFHKIWKGVFLRAGGFTPELAADVTDANEKDVIVFGRHFISNPDLPLRLQNSWPLSSYDRDTFYLPKSPVGYIDYPVYQESEA
jgi:2,4-dienoyl-CoA reductase-like NADH-dependent reductase (Old Yellow Enzyme family)